MTFGQFPKLVPTVGRRPHGRMESNHLGFACRASSAGREKSSPVELAGCVLESQDDTGCLNVSEADTRV